MRVATAAHLLGRVWQDIRHRMRAFVKAPLFTAIAVVSIAGSVLRMSYADFVDVRARQTTLHGIDRDVPLRRADDRTLQSCARHQHQPVWR